MSDICLLLIILIVGSWQAVFSFSGSNFPSKISSRNTCSSAREISSDRRFTTLILHPSKTNLSGIYGKQQENVLFENLEHNWFDSISKHPIIETLFPSNSPEFVRGVPSEVLQGAVLTGSLLGFMGDSFNGAILGGAMTFYLAISPGAAGDVMRSTGKLTGSLASEVPQLFSMFQINWQETFRNYKDLLQARQRLTPSQDHWFQRGVPHEVLLAAGTTAAALAPSHPLAASLMGISLALTPGLAGDVARGMSRAVADSVLLTQSILQPNDSWLEQTLTHTKQRVQHPIMAEEKNHMLPKTKHEKELKEQKCAVTEKRAVLLKVKQEEQKHLIAKKKAALLKAKNEKEQKHLAAEKKAALLKATHEKEQERLIAEKKAASLKAKNEKEQERLIANKKAALLKDKNEKKQKHLAAEKKAALLKAKLEKEQEEQERLAAEKKAALLKAKHEKEHATISEENEVSRRKIHELIERARVAAEKEAAGFVRLQAVDYSGLEYSTAPNAIGVGTSHQRISNENMYIAIENAVPVQSSKSRKVKQDAASQSHKRVEKSTTFMHGKDVPYIHDAVVFQQSSGSGKDQPSPGSGKSGATVNDKPDVTAKKPLLAEILLYSKQKNVTDDDDDFDNSSNNINSQPRGSVLKEFSESKRSISRQFGDVQRLALSRMTDTKSGKGTKLNNIAQTDSQFDYCTIKKERGTVQREEHENTRSGTTPRGYGLQRNDPSRDGTASYDIDDQTRLFQTSSRSFIQRNIQGKSSRYAFSLTRSNSKSTPSLEMPDGRSSVLVRSSKISIQDAIEVCSRTSFTLSRKLQTMAKTFRLLLLFTRKRFEKFVNGMPKAYQV